MTKVFLNDYQTSLAEKLTFLISPIYSERHYQEYLNSTTWQGRAVHFVLSAIEKTVMIGPLIALIEAAVALIWLKLSTQSPAKDRSFKIEVKKVDLVPPLVKGEDKENPKPPIFETNPKDGVEKVRVSATKVERIIPQNQSLLEINKTKKVKVSAPIESVREAENRRKGTEVILTTKGFERDKSDRLGRNGYKGEVQGNSALRFATARETKINPRAISLFSLKEKRESNLEQYLILKCKRFAHAWNLKGFLKLPSGKEFNMEGFCEAFTVPMIASSFLDFAKDSLFFTEDDYQWIVHEFNQTSSSDYTEADDIAVHSLVIPDSNFCGPISLGTGYDWHSTGTIFFGNYLIYCNRGGGDGGTGIHVIYLPDKSKINDAVIFEMIKRQEVLSGDFFGFSRILRDLGGESLYYFEMPPQSAGNCTYTSMLLVLYAMMILKYLIKNNREPHLHTDSKEWQEAFESLEPVYSSFVVFDQQQVLQDMLDEIEEWLDRNNAFSRYPLKEIYLQLLTSCREREHPSAPLWNEISSVIARINDRN